MELFIHHVEKRGYRLLFVGLALVASVLYDLFFWHHRIGVNLALFAGIYLAIFLILLAITEQLKQIWGLLLLVPIACLSVDAMWFNNALVNSVVPVLVPVLLILFSLLITLEHPKGLLFYLSKIPLIAGLFFPLKKYITVFFRDLSRKREESNGHYKKVLIGFLIAAPLVLIFGILFASADAIFADYIKRVFDLEFDVSTIFRVCRTIVMWTVLSAFFYAIVSKEHILSEKKLLVERFDSTIVFTILLVLNLLFAAFVLIQLKYLFGSYDYVLTHRMVFSEYARKGFFQLVWAVVFAGLIFLIVYRSFAHHGMKWPLKVLHLLFLVQTGVIAISALKRMNIYQEAYGFTVLRLFVEWFIYLVLALIVVGCLSVVLKWSFRNVVYTSGCVGLVAFVVLATLNIDYVIARKNVTRFVEEGKTLDFGYLNKLSIDTLPAFSVFEQKDTLEKLPAQERLSFFNLLKNKREVLNNKLTALEFNINRYRVAESLVNLEKVVGAQAEQLMEEKNAFERTRTALTQKQVNWCSDQAKLEKMVSYYSPCITIDNPNQHVIVTLSDETSTSTFVEIFELPEEGRGNTYLFVNHIDLPRLASEDQNEEDYSKNTQTFLTSEGRIVQMNDNLMEIVQYSVQKNGGNYTLVKE